jgi:hypothetical protein
VGLPAVDALLAGGAAPWILAFSQRLGRHVVATRDIQPGAGLVTNAEPLEASQHNEEPFPLNTPDGSEIRQHHGEHMLKRCPCSVCTYQLSSTSHAGELVLQERAVAALPRDKFAARLCHSCFKELKGVHDPSSDLHHWRSIMLHCHHLPQHACHIARRRLAHFYVRQLPRSVL